MGSLGWGQFAGAVGKILDRLTDRKRKIDGRILNIEITIKSLVGVPGTERRAAELGAELSRLRAERARIKDLN